MNAVLESSEVAVIWISLPATTTAVLLNKRRSIRFLSKILGSQGQEFRCYENFSASKSWYWHCCEKNIIDIVSIFKPKEVTMSIIRRNDFFPAMYSLFDDMMTRDFWGQNNSSTNTTIPAVNIRETNDEFIVDVAAPG